MALCTTAGKGKGNPPFPTWAEIQRVDILFEIAEKYKKFSRMRVKSLQKNTNGRGLGIFPIPCPMRERKSSPESVRPRPMSRCCFPPRRKM